MTFKDISAQVVAVAAQRHAIERECERRWKISDNVEAWISVSAYIENSDGAFAHVSVQGNKLTYGSAYVSEFAARELRQIAAIKDLVEDWKAGKIAGLPADCPREILELR